MILTGSDAIQGMMHLTVAKPDHDIVFFHDGKRYGGFKTDDHARFVMYHMGIRAEIVHLPKPIKE